MSTMELKPMELPAEVTDARLQHDHRIADATNVERHRPEPIRPTPHYRDSLDAKTRTTAISEVT